MNYADVASHEDADVERVGDGVNTTERTDTKEQGQPGLTNNNQLAAADLETCGKLPLSNARCIALVATATCAAFLNTLGVQSSVIVLPTIGKELDIPDSRLQWIVSAYNLSFGCFLLLWGRLADVYGKRLIFIWGSIWVTVTSIIIPFIPNEIGFDILRGLQGLGSAAMVPTAIGILGVTFPPGKAKNYAFSCFAGGAPLGSVFGNIFGGVLGHYLSWRWIYWVYGMLAAACTIASFFTLPSEEQHEASTLKNTVDWVGGSIVTIGLIGLLFALSEGNGVGWSTPWVPTLIGISILLIIAFGFWQHHLETKTDRQPLMKLSVFRNVRFSAANAIMSLSFASFNSYLIFATYWFQDFQGLSVIQTTLRFIPTGVTGILVAIVTAQLLSRVSALHILTFGTAAIALSAFLFAIPIPVHTTYWAYGFPAMVLSVCGMDTLFPVLTLFVAKTLPQEDQAIGGALINMVSQVGRSVGLALSTAVQTAVQAESLNVAIEDTGRDRENGTLGPWSEAMKSGIRSAEWFNFGLGAAALLVTLGFFRGAGIVGGKL